MRKPSAGQRTPQQQRFVLDELAKIEHALSFHEPLSQPDRLVLMRVLRELLDGRDARVELGIAPKRGARPSKRGHHAWLAGHYWHLRLRMREKDTAALAAVAAAWSVSASQVRKIARPMKADWQRRFDTGEYDSILNTVESLIPSFKQLSAKSR